MEGKLDFDSLDIVATFNPNNGTETHSTFVKL